AEHPVVRMRIDAKLLADREEDDAGLEPFVRGADRELRDRLPLVEALSDAHDSSRGAAWIRGKARADSPKLRTPCVAARPGRLQWRGDAAAPALHAVRVQPSRATCASGTTRVLGSGCSLAPTQRRHIVPRRWPAVSSQLGTPGSRSDTTRRTEPSARVCAEK